MKNTTCFHRVRELNERVLGLNQGKFCSPDKGCYICGKNIYTFLFYVDYMEYGTCANSNREVKCSTPTDVVFIF